MRRRNFLLPVVALAGLVLFFCFLVRLLLLRYERGDVYPAYSTMRADPLGTRAYYEALDSMHQYPVVRGFTSLHRELDQKPGTLFYLGMDAYDVVSFTKEEIAELDAYVKNGGRVVLTFKPEEPGESSSDEDKKTAGKKKEGEPPKKDASKPDKSPQAQAPEIDSDQNSSEPQTQQEKHEREELRQEQKDSKDDSDKDSSAWKYHRSLAALWGFSWELNKADEGKKQDDDASDSSSETDEEKPEVLALRSADGNLESSVPWKSALYFVRLEPDWQRLYDAKFKPVLIQRAWGKGEIIVATDSYLISNEALRNNRCPELLGLLAGPPGRLLFDETHLGTQEQEGVMFLANKFRLEGYLYGMLGVVLLFLWRNSVPLVPPRASGGHALLGGTVSGKDSRSGLVNLLRRNIAGVDILKTSFAEWKRNVTPGRRHLQGKMSEMESILSAAETSRADKMIQSYHQLREINTPSRAKGNYATKS
jgi:hypothetical protein